MAPHPRALVLLWCACAALAAARAAAVTTQETLVVARDDESTPVASTTNKSGSDITTEGPLPPIKLSEMDVRSDVRLRYAHTYVATRVRNPANRAQETTFRVLLPETAFISGFVMTLDGKSYKAYVKEKEEAKQIYNQAVSQGIGAAHIATKARDSNHFTVSVNVEPNTEAVFNLTYEELLVRRSGVYHHAVNLHPGALVPRLTVTVHVAEGSRLTALRVPEMRTGNEVDATEDDAQNTKAVIEKSSDGKEATITFKPDLEEQQKLMEIYAEKTKESSEQQHPWYISRNEEKKQEGVLGQFVVQYDVERPKDGEILVSDGYFVHFYAPSSLPPLSKHVVFVLDTSGSMMGRKVIQLREAMKSILGELNPGDYFSIVEFASYVRVHGLDEADAEPPRKLYYEELGPTTLLPPSLATPTNIDKAKVIVGRLDAAGGTNIGAALDVAIELIKKGVNWIPKPLSSKTSESTTIPAVEETTTELVDEDSRALKQKPQKDDDASDKLEPLIIFLTDGEPTVGETQPDKIISRLSEKNYGNHKAAIFSLAFGEDADRGFLRKLSLKNEGFMRHIYEASDAALQLHDFYRQVSSPLLADVKFTYPPEQIKEGSLTKHKFRMIYDASEVIVAGRVADDALELTPEVDGFCGMDDGNGKKRYRITPKVPVPRKKGVFFPLERLWAYLTIKQLLDERDASEGTTDEKQEGSPSKKALALALKYEFVTPLTSLVVVKPNSTNAVDAESVDTNKDDGPIVAQAFGSSSLVVGGVPMSSGFGPPGAAYFASQSLPSAYRPYSPLRSSVTRKKIKHRVGVSNGNIMRQDDTNQNLGLQVQSYPIIEQESLDASEDIDYDSISSTTRRPLIYTTSRDSIPLQSLLLGEFPWLATLTGPDLESIRMIVNGTVVDLKLARIPVDDLEAECARAVDGGAGVCVYIARCDPAKSITVDLYKQTYCRTNQGFAGVCCPKDGVNRSITTPQP